MQGDMNVYHYIDLDKIRKQFIKGTVPSEDTKVKSFLVSAHQYLIKENSDREQEMTIQQLLTQKELDQHRDSSLLLKRTKNRQKLEQYHTNYFTKLKNKSQRLLDSSSALLQIDLFQFEPFQEPQHLIIQDTPSMKQKNLINDFQEKEKNVSRIRLLTKDLSSLNNEINNDIYETPNHEGKVKKSEVISSGNQYETFQQANNTVQRASLKELFYLDDGGEEALSNDSHDFKQPITASQPISPKIRLSKIGKINSIVEKHTFTLSEDYNALNEIGHAQNVLYNNSFKSQNRATKNSPHSGSSSKQGSFFSIEKPINSPGFLSQRAQIYKLKKELTQKSKKRRYQITARGQRKRKQQKVKLNEAQLSIKRELEVDMVALEQSCPQSVEMPQIHKSIASKYNQQDVKELLKRRDNENENIY